MAQQLVYTSAPKLLDAGRSGFGTVARSKSISPLLVSAIERVSQFANIRGTERSRVIFVHRRIIAANNRVHLLSRIADAGADYTGRTNHIAHHLIVSQEEMNRAAASGINPANVLLQFPWFSCWEGTPKYFGPEDDVSLESLVHSRGGMTNHNAWTRLTGNPIHARLLAWDGAPRNGVLLIPVGVEPLGLLSEALAEFGAQSWSRTFTTNLETTDEMADFDWIVSSPENFREIEGRCGARARLDTSQPQTLPVPHEIVASKQQTAPSRMTGAHGSNGQATTPRVESYLEGRAASKAATEAPSRIPVPTIHPKSRKKHTLTLVAIAAALVLTGVILSRTVMDSKDLKDPPKISAAEKVKVKARRILEEVGVSPGKIDEYVKNPGEKHDEWANHASALLSKFQSSLNNNELRSGSEGKPEGQTQSAWLNKLDEANDVLAEYDRIDHKDYYERIKKLNVVYARLQEVAKELNDQPLSKEEARSFCKLLVESELKKLFGGEDWSSHGEERIKTILRDHFGKEKNPCAYETLCEYIRNHFNKFVGDSIEKIFCDAATINGQDAENLKQALACWKDPQKPFSDELKRSAGKGFVPEDFEKLLDEHRSKNQISEPDEVAASQKPNELTDSEMPAGLDFSSVPEKEIIIVTRKQLEKGVEVALLKALMGGDLDDDNQKKHLNKFLKIDGKDIKEKYADGLVFVEKQEYYSKYWQDLDNATEQKIHKDGKYSLANTDALDVLLSVSAGEKKFEAWIVIDDASLPPPSFHGADITFQIIKRDANSFSVDGEALGWISTLKPVAQYEAKLGGLPLPTNFLIERKLDVGSNYKLSHKMQNELAKGVADFKEKNDARNKATSTKKNESKAIEQGLVNSFNNFVEDVKIATGEMFISSVINLEEGKQLSAKEHYDTIKNDVLTPLKIEADPDNSGEEIKINGASKRVGEKKWEEVLKKCDVDGRLIKSLQSDDGFNSLKPEDLQKINSCITKKIQHGNKKAEDYISDFHEKEITVKTISGRLLFTAKQRK